jgi:hypothetical protein
MAVFAMEELPPEERDFIIWALGYVEGAALEMHDDKTGQQANAIVEKLKGRRMWVG